MDLEVIARAAARNGRILELNAFPSRLDLNDVHASRARELGVNLVIGTDAHDMDHLPFMKFGIGVARRAWCEARHIVNTLSLEELLVVLRRGR